jgi:hypothetical protein
MQTVRFERQNAVGRIALVREAGKGRGLGGDPRFHIRA